MPSPYTRKTFFKRKLHGVALGGQAGRARGGRLRAIELRGVLLSPGSGPSECSLALACLARATGMWRKADVVQSHDDYWWIRKFTPELVGTFKQRRMPVGERWRLDKASIRVNGKWRYFYRARDRCGQAINFLLTAHRERAAVLRFLKKAWRQNGIPSSRVAMTLLLIHRLLWQ